MNGFTLISNKVNSLNGEILWSETYEYLPIIQAKGGQLINFFNDIFIIIEATN